MINFIKNIFLNMQQYDLKDLIGFVISAITIVAFLVAVDFFSAVSSLNISVKTFHLGYYMDSLKNYYTDNNLKFPNQIYENKSLNKIFSQSLTKRNPNYIDQGDADSDELAVKAIANGQDITTSGFVEYRIKKLEKQLDNYTYEKHVYSFNSDRREFYDEQDFKPVLDIIQSKLSKEEYYTFLVALIRSRERFQNIFINNDGDVDLKNVKITIPAPLSKVTESREKNILSFQVVGKLLHEVANGTVDLTIYLPSLKKGQFLSLQITTRENQIKSEEIFYSYARDNIINKNRILLYFCIILLVMVILKKFVFKGETSEQRH